MVSRSTYVAALVLLALTSWSGAAVADPTPAQAPAQPEQPKTRVHFEGDLVLDNTKEPAKWVVENFKFSNPYELFLALQGFKPPTGMSKTEAAAVEVKLPGAPGTVPLVAAVDAAAAAAGVIKENRPVDPTAAAAGPATQPAAPAIQPAAPATQPAAPATQAAAPATQAAAPATQPAAPATQPAAPATEPVASTSSSGPTGGVTATFSPKVNTNFFGTQRRQARDSNSFSNNIFNVSPTFTPKAPARDRSGPTGGISLGSSSDFGKTFRFSPNQFFQNAISSAAEPAAPATQPAAPATQPAAPATQPAAPATQPAAPATLAAAPATQPAAPATLAAAPATQPAAPATQPAAPATQPAAPATLAAAPATQPAAPATQPAAPATQPAAPATQPVTPIVDGSQNAAALAASASVTVDPTAAPVPGAAPRVNTIVQGAAGAVGTVAQGAAPASPTAPPAAAPAANDDHCVVSPGKEVKVDNRGRIVVLENGKPNGDYYILMKNGTEPANLVELDQVFTAARTRAGTHGTIDALGQSALDNVHGLGIPDTVGAVEFGAIKVSCEFRTHIWNNIVRGVKAGAGAVADAAVGAANAVGDQFEKDGKLHKSVHLPYIFARNAVTGAYSGMKDAAVFVKKKGPNFFKKLFWCWPSKPIRAMGRGIRNNGERSSLEELLEGNEEDYGKLVVAAKEKDLISQADLDVIYKRGDIRALWQDMIENPRKAKGSKCEKGTGESGNPEMQTVIDNRYREKMTREQAVDDALAEKQALAAGAR